MAAHRERPDAKEARAAELSFVAALRPLDGYLAQMYGEPCAAVIVRTGTDCPWLVCTRVYTHPTALRPGEVLVPSGELEIVARSSAAFRRLIVQHKLCSLGPAPVCGGSSYVSGTAWLRNATQSPHRDCLTVAAELARDADVLEAVPQFCLCPLGA